MEEAVNKVSQGFVGLRFMRQDLEGRNIISNGHLRHNLDKYGRWGDQYQHKIGDEDISSDFGVRITLPNEHQQMGIHFYSKHSPDKVTLQLFVYPEHYKHI